MTRDSAAWMFRVAWMMPDLSNDEMRSTFRISNLEKLRTCTCSIYVALYQIWNGHSERLLLSFGGTGLNFFAQDVYKLLASGQVSHKDAEVAPVVVLGG